MWGLFTSEEVRALSINALELITMLWAEITLSTAQPHASHVLAFEVGLVAIARAGEIVSGLPQGALDVSRHPTRADLSFEYDSTGTPISANKL